MTFHCCDNVADFWARPWSRDGSRRAILSRRSGIEMKQLSAKVDAGQCQRWVHVWTTPALQGESDVRLAVAQFVIFSKGAKGGPRRNVWPKSKALAHPLAGSGNAGEDVVVGDQFRMNPRDVVVVSVVISLPPHLSAQPKHHIYAARCVISARSNVIFITAFRSAIDDQCNRYGNRL
jgi:hypothetical protein